MKRFLSFLFLCVVCCSMFAQQLQQPVKWSISLSEKESSSSTILFSALVEEGWHVYTTSLPDDGPVPTQIIFDSLSNVILVGDLESETPIVTKYDEAFAMNLSWYDGNVNLSQSIKIEDSTDFFIRGYVRFMCCNEESCMPPKNVDFVFSSNEISSSTIDDVEEDLGLFRSLPDYWQPVSEENETDSLSKKISLWYVFFAGLLGGILALFTPCVWPIIPMTVSFFLKRSQSRRRGIFEATFYGLSIFVIYLTLGVFVTLVLGADALNVLSTNAFVNVFFFVLLVVFAVSFFGYFEIELPSSWANILNSKASNTTGIISILFMAFVLVIVSFSCTGPIIGTLLVELSTMQSILSPLVGMAGFALALALPFSLFAIFPSWIDKMPRSGSWMGMVKIVLAFIELYFALKFLSVADLTMGWGILPRNVFILCWIIISLCFSFYLFGILRFPAEGKVKIFFGRKILALIPLLFAIYLTTGFFGNSLKQVSAFLPPQPTENHVFNDYDEGMAFAQKNNKMVFLDFTGYGCVNCRKMEGAVFSNEKVKERLADFVQIQLFVDDRTTLQNPFVISEINDTIMTVGEKWSFLQQYKFKANAQPYYLILSSEGKLLSKPYAYDENIEKFLNWLNSVE